jgi:hypothetical protein
MKKLITVLTIALLTLSSNLAYSEDSEPEKMEADAEYVMSLLRLCKGYAQDDGVEKLAMNSYLLTCINDELEEADYKLITVLPKDKDEG